MSYEFNALQAQGTWSLVSPPSNHQIIGCKWIFKIKRLADSSIAHHKARLVAQGYKQEYGIDYLETFIPVVKFPTIRFFLTVALHYNWQVFQLDVVNAFLHGNIDKTIYMSQPPGFADPQLPNHVCLLRKAIYGLKQSPRLWFATLTSYLSSQNFQVSSADPSFLLLSKNNIIVYIFIYVDDILITDNNSSFISSLITNLHNKFQIRNLGPLSRFLGIDFTRTSTGFHLTQNSYIQELLNIASMTNCKPIQTPLPNKFPTDPSLQQPFAQPALFRQIIGSLQYLSSVRPDIAFVFNKFFQQMHKPLLLHYQLLKRVLRYLC
ncbi:hypothetical protein KFK09_001467 [Dendrobium nobile]|uniref:Reverse transcriptase Ty1/copia-type domain-containing protein n=1 Tax=Dendrobium nobile TaxID=94219 RepID=A0A8T3C579_DENNO|nr:hypothetical protein KFK09_001467 [Dendrobium nobile]